MNRRIAWCGGIVVLAAAATWAQRVPVPVLPNGDFELGEEKAPAAWRVSSADWGAWVKEQGVDGGAALSIAGDGRNEASWESDALELPPHRCFRFSFLARSVNAKGGTVVSGPRRVNVDVGIPREEWTPFANVFCTPVGKDVSPETFRLGQWHMSGEVLFDRVSLVPVTPVYRQKEGLTLGAGEVIDQNTYTFYAPLSSVGRNHSRPLFRFRDARFNTDRWCLSDGAVIVYKHELTGRTFSNATVKVSCGYYVRGKVFVDVSKDGKEWTALGYVDNKTSEPYAVPAAMLPAEALLVRLRAAKETDLQIPSYGFEATVSGTPVSFEGETDYVEVTKHDPKLAVELRGLGNPLPGGENLVSLFVRNATGGAVETNACVVFSAEGRPAYTNAMAVNLPAPGIYDVLVPYAPPPSGTWRTEIAIGDAFQAFGEVTVPSYFDSGYGELLPVSHPALNVWRASSGWKIPRFRALPEKVAKSLAIRTAKNECEATQLVLTPNVALTNVLIETSPLIFGRSRIPAEAIEVLRVGYVPVQLPTDATGCKGLWPDPLLPQEGRLDVPAGENQPFWIRVKPPRETPAGIYRGRITVKADGGIAIPLILNVEVYDFVLPDTMTCEASLGCGFGNIYRYHKLTKEEDRRSVVDLYLKALSDHHISPYNPAPLDSWSVTWKGLSEWDGGVCDSEVKASGKSSRKIVDDTETGNPHTIYKGEPLKIPAKGFKITFKHKTDKGQKFLFSVNHLRADGSWMSGCNNDISIQGNAEWQTFENTVTSFAQDAAFVRFAFFPAGYQEPGVATGTLWLDDFTVTDCGSGKVVMSEPFEPVDLAKVEPVFNWAKWDAGMERAFDVYHFNAFVMHVAGLGGGTFQSRREPSFLGYPGDSPEYDLLMGKYLKGIESHLKEKGWLEKAYVYWFDEPDTKDYAFVMKGFDTLKRHAPGLRRMLTEQVEPELAGGPNLWVPLTPSLHVKGEAERRAAGDQFWWYVCCGPHAPFVTEFIDHPGSEMRLWLWQTWGENVTGILIWETLWWTSNTAFPDPARPQNPYTDAMSWVGDGSLASGTKRPWGNGDGRFLYPPLAAADARQEEAVLAGPNASYRLEMMRDGIEDYEYFAMLKRLIAEKAAKLSPDAKKRYEELLIVPKTVYTSLTDFTVDPAPMEAHRDVLARAIVELLKK